MCRIKSVKHDGGNRKAQSDGLAVTGGKKVT